MLHQKGANKFMPGYYLHLVACTPHALENRNFLHGVEAPDILKKYLKVYGIDGVRDKYNNLKIDQMPDFEVLKERIQQKESYDSTNGLHYGLSSKPDIKYFWNSLSTEEKQNPFYRGYLWHLLTDLLMYTRLDIDTKFANFIKEHENDENLEALKKQEVKKLHADWDKTNAKVRDTYTSVTLPPEVEELGVVQFIDEGTLNYVDWEILKETIDFLRKFDPLQENVEDIIQDILNNI